MGDRRHDLNVRVVLLQAAADAGEGAAGAQPGHEGVHLGKIAQDLEAGSLVVGAGVGLVAVLVGHVVAVWLFGDHALGLEYRVVGAAGPLGVDNVGAERPQQLLSLRRDDVRQHAEEAIALNARHHRQADAGVAAGGLQDRLVRRQLAALFGGVDHVEGDAVLEGAGGVLPLQLGVDVDAGLGAGAPQPHEGCIADGVKDSLGKHGYGAADGCGEARNVRSRTSQYTGLGVGGHRTARGFGVPLESDSRYNALRLLGSERTMIETTRPQPMTIGGREFVWGGRTYVMGIVNVTPDSFSGDGVAYDVAAAVDLAVGMSRDGADIIDVGGESTRPGFEPISIEEEIRRTVPVIEKLVREVDIPLSIDTCKAEVARAALAAGAHLVNDVHGFRREPETAAAAAEFGVPAVAMHNQREREFHDVIGDVTAGLVESLRIAREQGLPDERVIVDPGFNFGWTEEQALEMLRRLGELRALGRPLLVGTSRKSTIGAVLGLPVEERLEGTAATVALAIASGADIVRVHDVKEMTRVARMADAVVRGWTKPEGTKA